jgi:alpha-ketoglutarate-dependent taurine dioxygenase
MHTESPTTVRRASELEDVLVHEGAAIVRLGSRNTAARLQQLVHELGTPVDHKHSDQATHLVEIRVDGSYDATRRPQSTPEHQSAHTDGAFLARSPAIVAMCGLAAAASGGESIVVYGNELLQEALATVPASDLSILFASDCYRVHRGEESLERPVLSLSKDGTRLRISFGSHEFNRVDVAPAAEAAFRLVERLRMRRDLERRFLLMPGDALFLANFSVLHGRSAWIDGPGQKRHLLRAWVEPEPGSPLDATGIDPDENGALRELTRLGSKQLCEQKGGSR